MTVSVNLGSLLEFIPWIPVIVKMTWGRNEKNRPAIVQIPNYKLPVTSSQLPVTSYQLPITNYQLPITNYQNINIVN